jgi:hypothetical protein
MRATLGRANLSFFAAFTLIASGCLSLRPYDPGPGRRVAARVPQEIYRLGEPINVTISNLSDVTLFYPDGFCRTQLQKRDGSLWRPISDPSVGCPVERGFLDPGQTVVHQFRLPKGVAGGTYRFAIPMPTLEEATGPEPELLTPAFSVQDSSH